jgi:uncharacterized sulfatase
MNTAERGATMKEIRRCERAGELTEAMELFSTDRKPVEELYDLQSDPHEINNLALEPAAADKLAELRGALAEWQIRIGDVGLIPEPEIELAEATAGSRFAILRQGQDTRQIVTKLVRVASQASEGIEALDALIAALADDNPAVRYWAATGIGNLGSAAIAAQGSVQQALTDESASVRIAAARAVAKLGDTEAALQRLSQELESDQQWDRLMAAIVLDEMDEQARAALPALRAAMKKQPNKYIVRVANRAVNELQGTDHQVP